MDQVPGEQSPDQRAWTVLAHLLRPQGRKGELLAELLTDFPERFADRRSVALRKPDGATQPATVTSHWLPVGKNAGRVVLKFQGIDSINDAERLNGLDVVIPSEQRAELEDDAAYIADLLGCTVLDGDRVVGVVDDVHFPANTAGVRIEEAAPLLVVLSPAGDEILIPYAKAWILKMDLSGKRIEMRLPEGLLEING